MSRGKMPAIVCAIAVGVSLSVMVLRSAAAAYGRTALQQNGVSSVYPLSLDKLIKKNGWRVPGQDDFSTISRVETINIGGVVIRKSYLQAPSEFPLYELETYSVDKDNNLVIGSMLCSVQDLFRFDAGGHVFAFEAALVPTSVSYTGSRQYLGASYRVYFYDEDGSNSFKTRIGRGPLLVPEWVKTTK